MLYVVLLGGTHARARVELHDIAFASASDLIGTYSQLRAQWFGEQKGLHIDAWMEVDGVDGFRVQLADEPPAADATRLYLINLGGYSDLRFGEEHAYVLVAAASKAAAKALGKQRVLDGWSIPHVDAVIDVDDCIEIDRVDGRFVTLVKGEHKPLRFRNTYQVIA